MVQHMSPRSANAKTATVKVSAKIPVPHERALKQKAEDEGRSMANVIRLAIHNTLKQDGRVL